MEKCDLNISRLSIGYGQSIIQESLTLTAHSGEMICLLGTNGCGKSTLLRTLSGLQPALSGDVILSKTSTSLLSLTEKERAKWLSVVLTERISADRTTVHDIVAIGRYPYSNWLGGLTQKDERLIQEAIEQVEMQHKMTAYFNELSDGEKQRVLIAKAIAQQTPFILLDEPTAHLDLPNRIKTLLLLRTLAHENGRTILISTHELDLTLQTADTIWLMKPHAGVAVGTAEELIRNKEFQRAFEDPHFHFVTDGNNQLKIDLRS